MFLSIQQRYILDVLQKLGCIRKSQLFVLVREKFQNPDVAITERGMDTMLGQLRSGMRDIRMEGNIVCLAGVVRDSLYFEAIDVMLELSDGFPLDFQAERDGPYLLSFSLGAVKIHTFSLAVLTESLHPGIVRRRQMERIVWISASGLLPETLELPEKQFFAARNSDGAHRFYGSSEL